MCWRPIRAMPESPPDRRLLESRPKSSLPTITSLSQFTRISEFYVRNEDGSHSFDETIFLLVQEDGPAYYGSLLVERRYVTLQQATECLAKIPDDEVHIQLYDQTF